jgi:riboflavin biosynthesis pyrimidine reductase
MALIATLVVGANGATAMGGNSSQLSTPPDRARFLSLHRSAAAIITGKYSAKSEDYSQTKVPIYIFTRSGLELSLLHPYMQSMKVEGNLAEASREIQSRFSGNVVVEAGPQLLQALIGAGVVDELQLSISPIDGDGNFIEITELLKDFEIESEEVVDGTRLLKCRYRGDAANS